MFNGRESAHNLYRVMKKEITSNEEQWMNANGMDFLRKLVNSYGWRDEHLNDNKSPQQLCEEFLRFREGKTNLDGEPYEKEFVTLGELGYTKDSLIDAIQSFIADLGAFDDDERIAEAKESLSLLRSADEFSLDDAEKLISWSVTRSDECCLENRDDYEIEEWLAATRKMNKFNRALEILIELGK